MSITLQRPSMRLRYIDKGYRDLRTALKSLSDQSLKTSRRLDDTYYSILEKVSVLRQTIGSLQELSGLTKELRENFESDTKELVEDVQGQYDGFDNFDNQQHQIVVLEDRIKISKKKADSLTDRLAKAKERVDARAQAELEWAAKNSRRFCLIGIYHMYADMAFRPHTNPLVDIGVDGCSHLCYGSLPPFQAGLCHP
jgi:chromosome segregation ATPase